MQINLKILLFGGCIPPKIQSLPYLSNTFQFKTAVQPFLTVLSNYHQMGLFLLSVSIRPGLSLHPTSWSCLFLHPAAQPSATASISKQERKKAFTSRPSKQADRLGESWKLDSHSHFVDGDSTTSHYTLYQGTAPYQQSAHGVHRRSRSEANIYVPVKSPRFSGWYRKEGK